MKVSIGVNLRVTGYCCQGDRKYMEDCFSVAYQQTEDERDLEYAYIGIYDGHGGADASKFAKAHLMKSIIKHKNFWSNNDEEVLRAIKDGFIATHYAMWREQENWPKTATGLPSTAGTTASIAFIRRGKIYVGHVGDSGIVLGYQPPNSTEWKAKPLTRDHKPENADEMRRIQQCGGKVIQKSGVPRVVWNRPRNGHQGPVRRSTPIDEIPFLAVARSLGDLWSYNSSNNQFIVSPNPDCSVVTIDTSIHRCLIFGTDGLFNMMSPQTVVSILHQTEKHNEVAMLNSVRQSWLNPSKLLVEKALERWKSTYMRADNTTVVILMIDPPGPPKAQVLKNRQKKYPAKGLEIMRRFKETEEDGEDSSASSDKEVEDDESCVTKEEESQTTATEPLANSEISTSETDPSTSTPTDSNSTSPETNSYPLKERNFVSKNRESTSFDPREHYNGNKVQNEKENQLDTSNQMFNSETDENSSSSSQVFPSAPDESESTSNTSNVSNKHNLRSSVKTNSTLDDVEPNGSLLKRKNGENEDEPLRKSVRLDKAKSKFGLSKENNLRQSTSKLNIVQKIMKGKKLNRRRKVFRRVAIKQKLKLLQDTVKSNSSSTSLVRIVSKSILQKKNINVSECTGSQAEISKTGRTDLRLRRRPVDTSLTSKSPADSSSRKRTPPNGDLKINAAGTSGHDTKVKSGNSEKINDGDSPKNFSSSKHSPYSKKSSSPQRKSLRQSVLNQTPKFHKRISKGK